MSAVVIIVAVLVISGLVAAHMAGFIIGLAWTVVKWSIPVFIAYWAYKHFTRPTG